MNHGSLFSGRGGFEIGARNAGIETLWVCELDDFLRNKLKKIVPDAKRYRDVQFVKNPPRVDIISAGFPCQDISIAAQAGRAGIKGARSGLWREVARITDEVKPDYLVLENSPELRRKGLEYVLSDLSAIGYDAEWDCFGAANFGYPHYRRRIIIVAYPMRHRRNSPVLRPPGAYALSQNWTPTAAYLRVTGSRADGFGDCDAILRGDVVPNFRREIHGFGNAIMPVLAEHVFRCIIEDLGR
jgi:DNA (cytosine-5)-methyltransferase 1